MGQHTPDAGLAVQGGWTRDPASPLPGETATSEAAATDVTVTAPPGDQVLTGGLAEPPQPAPGGQRRWHFRAPTARDVAVAVGPFRLTTAQIAVPAGPPVAVTVAVAPGLGWAGPDVLAEVRRALPRLAARFGPVPFPALRLAGLPGLVPSGIEYPAMMLLLGQRPQQDTRLHTQRGLVPVIAESASLARSRDRWRPLSSASRPTAVHPVPNRQGREQPRPWQEHLHRRGHRRARDRNEYA